MKKNESKRAQEALERIYKIIMRETPSYDFCKKTIDIEKVIREEYEKEGGNKEDLGNL